MKKVLSFILLAVVVIAMVGCQSGAETSSDTSQFKVVATTTMLADLTKVIGGDVVMVEGLMGPGIDPHLYKASAGDVTRMQEADMVVFNGLHLEGKMGEIFENLSDSGKLIVEIAPGIDQEKLLGVEDDPSVHDPHIWFDVAIWKEAALVVRDGLKELSAEDADTFEANYKAYIEELDSLDAYVAERVLEVPENQRVLVTAHDAFAYFGHAYGFEVKGIQGISTASEAGTGDLRDLANFIVERNIKAVFIESSVPKKNVEALQEAVAAKGGQIIIGGELFSDSLGSPGTDAETYIGTVRSNVDTIVEALK